MATDNDDNGNDATGDEVGNDGERRVTMTTTTTTTKLTMIRAATTTTMATARWAMA